MPQQATKIKIKDKKMQKTNATARQAIVISSPEEEGSHVMNGVRITTKIKNKK